MKIREIVPAMHVITFPDKSILLHRTFSDKTTYRIPYVNAKDFYTSKHVHHVINDAIMCNQRELYPEMFDILTGESYGKGWFYGPD